MDQIEIILNMTCLLSAFPRNNAIHYAVSIRAERAWLSLFRPPDLSCLVAANLGSIILSECNGTERMKRAIDLIARVILVLIFDIITRVWSEARDS